MHRNTICLAIEQKYREDVKIHFRNLFVYKRDSYNCFRHVIQSIDSVDSIGELIKIILCRIATFHVVYMATNVS